MFKKNFLLLCALTAAYAPVAVAAPDCFREDEIVDLDLTNKGKKKCCRCCSLTVTGNASIGGNLTVGGTVTAANFITTGGDTLFNGLRNWAVFSNDGGIVTPGTTTIPWDGAPAFTPKGIANAAGEITLPTTGIFLVMYTVRLELIGQAADESAIVFLRQSTAAGGAGMTQITQAAITTNSFHLPVVATAFQETQLTGYAIITVTSAANNVIDLRLTLPAAGITVPSATSPDANAEITILQLN